MAKASQGAEEYTWRCQGRLSKDSGCYLKRTLKGKSENGGQLGQEQRIPKQGVYKAVEALREGQK